MASQGQDQSQAPSATDAEAPPPHQHPPPPQQPSPVPGNPNDAFICQWVGCGERAPSAEALYDHVCDRHIGRKSTNNLNLQCAWGNCHIAVVKRDHITSHIRVHVPLKPHRCEFCGKAFKRPQDLKKHVKTHADDPGNVGSQANRSNQQGNQPNGQHNIYGNPMQGKPPANYYPDQQMQMNYGPQGHNGTGAPSFYGPAPPQSAFSYGVDYANTGHDMNNQATLESMKNGLDILRRLFPEHQRGDFDPRSYQQVESRIAALQNLHLPFLANPMLASGQPIAAGGGGGGGNDLYGPSQYSLPPMDNLRTKNELVNLDQLFATMQSTIYDNPTEISQAGLGQPGAVPAANMGYHPTQSPTVLQPPSAHQAAATPSSHHSGTPALTPPSSAVSNTSGNSPPSMHLNTMSPNTSGGMYPTLSGPSATQGYVPSSMAPTPTLGSQFDQGQRRRYSGGQLRKAAPASHSRTKPEDAMDTTSDGVATPKNAITSSSSSDAARTPKVEDQQSTNFSSSNLDPALGGSTSPNAGEMSEEAVKANEAWVGNIRMIEALRAWVNYRLEHQIFEGENDEMDHDKKKAASEEKDNLYPVLHHNENE